MNRINYLLIILSFFCININAEDIDRLALTSKRLSTADGLSSNTVYDIQQDKNGFIWFGAAYGLCRYDGYSFANYYSLSSDGTKRSEATIGNLYKDDENDLIWIQTSTFTFACYDISLGKFIDYTGKGDEQRSYRRFIKQRNTMWMYDTRNGIRRIVYKDGRFECRDFNTENKSLPTNHIIRMVEDGAGNVWAMSNKGLIRIKGDSITLVENTRQVDGTAYEGNVVCLADDNKIKTYSPDCELLKDVSIPNEFGRLNYLRSHFVWQGKWMLFGKNTIAYDLSTFQINMPDRWQVQNGWLLDAIDGYYFESNRSGKLWIFPPEGEVRIMSLIPDMSYTAERNRRYNVKRGKDGLFYIATYGNGMFIYDYAKDKIRHFSANDEEPVISTNYLMNLLVDRSGCVWVSQESSGVSCISVSEESMASFVLPRPERKGDLSNFIRMAAYDDNGDILLSTSDNKLYTYDISTGSISKNSEQTASVYAYHKDRRGNVWMATRGAGLYINDKHYSRGGREPYKVQSDNYQDIAEDNKGRIWLSTYEDGLLMAEYDKDGKIIFSQFLARDNNEMRQHQLDIDSEGRLWIASYNGLYMLDTSKDSISNNDFLCFNTDNSSMPFNEVKCMTYSSNGYLWTGGKGSGVVRCRFDNDMKKLAYTRITPKEGLANNSISSIIEDAKGNIWASTESGLSMIYDKDMKVKTYHFNGNIERNIYSDDCAMKLNDGRLLFGTRYGVNIITPESGKEVATTAPMATITDIRINGILASDSCMLEFAPNYCKEIELDYKSNSISLLFSTLEFSNLQSALYQYYLEGVDNDWRPMTSINHIDYNNLAPGKYIFHIKTYNHNKWSDERTLAITIAQPWYNSWWAWLVYITIILLLVLYMYHNAREKLRLHEQMKVEKQITEFRLNFYTNMTHEFRTPLAIIQGAVNKLQLDSTSKAAIQTAQRGTKRLMKMVNQLMEFRKVNTGNMLLSVEQDDIITFVRDVYHDFWSIAEQKGLNMTFMPFAKHHIMLFDKQMMETMTYNLLSNAIKYTPEKGNITVKIKKETQDGKDVIAITVEDDGPGISKEQQANLFQPFMHGNVSTGGMGIGLYTSHRMASLHHGSLEYKRVNGSSLFTIKVPDTENEYSENEHKRCLALDTTYKKQEYNDEQILREPLPDSFNDITIAIIEDDYDMMEQISSEVAKYFHVNRYLNGQSALESITADNAKQPALIICDAMLPDMEGFDIVKQLKSDADTAHIPIIMLTALNDERHQLRCYEAGGDDYMVKPCNFRLLIGRAVQLIQKNRKKQTIETVNNETNSIDNTSPIHPSIITSAADKHFIDRINIIISQHLGDSELNVDMMAEKMGMGRTKFFNKTKELTGMSPNKYLQKERMRIAAELLKKGEFTVSEVSYKVGIQDASYFNKCFKAYYGVVPSKYAKGVEQ
ncbi:MAG: response regulator [Prevotella sp.]|nr:response regulator [Prevotella sp.]